jgi:ribosomal-protein-alanine N-acetyltransferase
MNSQSLAELHSACFITPRAWSAAEIEGLLDMPGAFLIEAPKGAGFLLGRAIAGEAEILTLAIAPQARRHGLARALLAEFETKACAHNTTSAFLEVSAQNDAAIALYLAAGFSESGRRRGYYTTPEGAKIDALILSKPLKQA